MVKVQAPYTRIALAILFSLALLSPPYQSGAAGVSPQGQPGASMAPAQSEPVAIWSISWTSTAVASASVDDPGYTSYAESYNYSQSGSTLYRVYEDGSGDNADFKLRIADDFDSTTTYVCKDVHGKITGYAPEHKHSSAADPEHYNGNPLGTWAVFPSQNPDDSWSMLFNWPIFYEYALFQTVRENGSDCGGGTWDRTYTWGESAWGKNCLPITLSGNSQGTEFIYHAQGNDFNDGCQGPSAWRAGHNGQQQAQWNVDVRVLLLKGRDLSVDHLEVTQGLQDGTNSIPLVQGRRTVVRAFLNIGSNPGPIKGVSGVLEVYSGGTKLGEVLPFNPDQKINAPNRPDWKKIDDTLNFELPVEWTFDDALHLTLEVNRSRNVVEEDYTNNKFSADVSLRACNGIRVGYTPIHYDPPGGYVPADPSANIAVGQLFMQKIYPVFEDGLTYEPRGAMTLMQGINITGTDTLLLKSLDDLLLISSPPHPDHIYGWLPSLAFDGNGEAHWPGSAAFGNDTEPDRWRRTFAHEVGHNLGLDDNFNGDLTTAGNHWFDVYDRVIKPVPASVGGDNLLDFMVPARLESEAWISPQNYNYLINKLCLPLSTSAAAKPDLPQASDNLLVSGMISNTTTASGVLSPLFSLATVPTTTLLIGSQYCVNLKDTSGNLLNGYCFNANFDYDSATPASAAGFSMVVPYPSGLKRVELTDVASAAVLSSQVASAHAPTVNVTYPNEGGLVLKHRQTITWTGSDLDGDPLTYMVLYSRDNGATWIGAGANITGESYSLDFATQPGTTGASGLIKVIASDGFYSAEDTSDNPFVVANKPPLANILSPSSGATFYTGSQIVLEGSGVDYEDSALGGSALSWVSSLDGALGAGKLLKINLSPGVHTITLTVTDSQGHQSTDSIQFTVVQSTIQHNLYMPVIRR